MNDATLELIIYIVSIVVITAVFIVIETQHIHIQIGTLIQAIPVIIAAIAAVQRALSPPTTNGTSSTSTTTVTTDPTAQKLHVDVSPAEPLPIGKSDSPKAP